MSSSGRWGGWIAFAGWLMIIMGALDFFEGLIAVIRGNYYVLTANQIIVFDMRTWGWVTLGWGIVIALVGWHLPRRRRGGRGGRRLLEPDLGAAVVHPVGLDRVRNPRRRGRHRRPRLVAARPTARERGDTVGRISNQEWIASR